MANNYNRANTIQVQTLVPDSRALESRKYPNRVCRPLCKFTGLISHVCPKLHPIPIGQAYRPSAKHRWLGPKITLVKMGGTRRCLPSVVAPTVEAVTASEPCFMAPPPKAKGYIISDLIVCQTLALVVLQDRVVHHLLLGIGMTLYQMRCRQTRPTSYCMIECEFSNQQSEQL